MRVRIRHTTRFRYAEPAAGSFNELRLTPRNDENQNLLSFQLTVQPKTRATSYKDHFGTTVHAFNIWAPHDELVIVGESTVMTYARPPVPADGGDLTQLADPTLRDAYAEWLHPSPLASGGDQLASFSQHIQRVVPHDSVLSLVTGIAHEVHERFTYATGESFVSSTVDDLLGRGTGVCQDFAHLMIATLRGLGVPARYVSGYFFADSNPATDVPIEVESHAWVEALLPGHGWVEVDPTNDCLADERHVIVAVGRDYSDVAPVRGVMTGGAGQMLDVSVTMVKPSVSHPEPEPPPVRRARQQAAAQQQ